MTRSIDNRESTPTKTMSERWPRPRVNDGILWAALLIGLIPWIGLLLAGSWNETELGIATFFVILSVWGLVAERADRRRSKSG